MNYTEKQYKFAKFLLYRIGFTDEFLIDEYLNLLKGIYGRTYSYCISTTNKQGYTVNRYVQKYSVDLCIKKLLREYLLKKEVASIEVIYKNNLFISANDLSNFTFCPVSYSLKKSFNTNIDLADKEEDFSFLRSYENINQKYIFEQLLFKNNQDEGLINFNSQFKKLVEKIRKCDIIFNRSKSPRQFFHNSKINFTCQPQYILKDPKGNYFVIEEKFRYLKSRSENIENSSSRKSGKFDYKNYFFENHLVKLRSYIDFIEDYKIKYCILIYWYYDFSYEELNIHDVSFKIIKQNDYEDEFNNALSNFLNFTNEKVINLEKRISLSKCVNCSVTEFCGHKMQTNNILKIPYNRYDMRLRPAVYP